MADEPAHLATSHLDPASRRVGTVLDGKWTLERLLGVGGMAAVYAGTHRNGARAAIKLFPFSVTTSPEFAERILREGYLANKIGHPAVVRVLDDHLDREREYAYLVMELLEGETARQRVERGGPMSPLEVTKFMLELMDCLAAAHDKGVVHRDIKPENLFLTDEGRLKVLDFGVARALDGTSSSVTRTGAMLGTPAYMSPEQARGRPSEVSTRSDLYSAGATLLFLVAGEFLHEGESAQEIMVRAAWTPAKKIRERGLGIPEPLAKIIDKACEFDATDRYQTASEMRRDLELTLAKLEGDPASSEPVARISKIPIRGPISTAPLPLSRSNRHAVTVSDAPGTPDDPTFTTETHRSRRTTWWVGAGVSAAIATVIVAVWPREATLPPPATPVAAPTAAAAATAATAAAVAEAPVPTVASNVAPVAPPEARVTTTPAPGGQKGKTTGRAASRPPTVSQTGSSTIAAPPRPAAPPAPSMRSTTTATRKTAPTGRDVGY